MEKLGSECLNTETTSVSSTNNHHLNKTDIRKKSFLKSVAILCIGLMFGTSCDGMELTRSAEVHEIKAMAEDSTKIDDKSGLSFELDSDSLEEEIENIYFKASEWEEEINNADI